MNPRLSLLKNIARRLLRRGRYYPIAFGPLRGLRLQFNDHVTLGELLGLWERNNFRVISLLNVAGLLESSSNTVLFDIGANFGLYTLFFAKLLRGQGRIFAFEPADIPRQLLDANINANGITNVVSEPLAVAGETEETHLYVGQSYHTSSLRAERAGTPMAQLRTIQVASTTLDDYWTRMQGPGEKIALVKIDIEGAADAALPSCSLIAQTERCFFLIESHSPAEDAAIGEFARNGRYELYRTTNRKWVRNSFAVHPDADGVWGTLLLIPQEKVRRAKTILRDR